MKLVGVAIAVLVALTQLPGQQGGDVEGGELTFTLDVKVVNVLATVKDRGGGLVDTLGKDDFILAEDGVRQEIRYFAHQADLPLTIGLLIDTSGSQQALIPQERSAGMQFFRSMLRPEKDLAFLMSFDRNVELLQDYTASLRLLEHGLQGLQVEVPGGGRHLPNPTGNRKQTSTALHDAVYLAADEMFRNQVGRKVIVVISDGYDMGSKISLKSAIEAAQRADIVVYSVQYLDRRYAGGYFSLGSGAGALKKMSQQTGGTAFSVSRGNRLAQIFERIEQEMRSQYSIGYSPSSGLDRPGFRRIELKAARKGLKVQTRDGYYADEV